MSKKGGTLLIHEGGILSRWNFPSRFSFRGRLRTMKYCKKKISLEGRQS